MIILIFMVVSKYNASSLVGVSQIQLEYPDTLNGNWGHTVDGTSKTMKIVVVLAKAP